MDLESIPLIVTPIQIIFIFMGVSLKCLIIYFEHFGRDTQKRSLLNRVSIEA